VLRSAEAIQSTACWVRSCYAGRFVGGVKGHFWQKSELFRHFINDVAANNDGDSGRSRLPTIKERIWTHRHRAVFASQSS
jgi:hypothetical protein